LAFTFLVLQLSILAPVHLSGTLLLDGILCLSQNTKTAFAPFSEDGAVEFQRIGAFRPGS
jgi:hypothetical protein